MLSFIFARNLQISFQPFVQEIIQFLSKKGAWKDFTVVMESLTGAMEWYLLVFVKSNIGMREL